MKFFATVNCVQQTEEYQGLYCNQGQITFYFSNSSAVMRHKDHLIAVDGLCFNKTLMEIESIYANEGIAQLLDRIIGNYTIYIVDRRCDLLIVITDTYNSHPVYHCDDSVVSHLELARHVGDKNPTKINHLTCKMFDFSMQELVCTQYEMPDIKFNLKRGIIYVHDKNHELLAERFFPADTVGLNIDAESQFEGAFNLNSSAEHVLTHTFQVMMTGGIKNDWTCLLACQYKTLIPLLSGHIVLTTCTNELGALTRVLEESNIIIVNPLMKTKFQTHNEWYKDLKQELINSKSMHYPLMSYYNNNYAEMIFSYLNK